MPQKLIAYSYYVDVLKRKELPFQNIKMLSEDYSFEQLNSITTDKDEANFYGDFFTLNRYCEMAFPNLPPKKFTIQHGVIFFTEKWEEKKSNLINLVWSKRIAKEFQTKLGCINTYSIGSPFFYAKSLLTEDEIKKERLRLGKNLLAFPMHSTHWVQCKYNEQSFIETLKKQKKKFDSVRICLYWKDIQKGAAEPFLREGFECVTCGHIFDPYFLQRQKSLFMISDATISNRLGSQAGYSIFMDKPHLIVPDTFDTIDDGNREVYEDSLISKERQKDFTYITDAFINNFEFKITNHQKEIIDEFWGLSAVKTSEEIQKIITKCYLS